MKFLVALVLLACASTVSANLFNYNKVAPAPAPVCTKGCKANYQDCQNVPVVELQCTQPKKPVYVAPTPAKPVYNSYGRKLSNYKPVYKQPVVVVKKPVVPAPAPAPVCVNVTVQKQVCTAKPCTTTTYEAKTTCQLVCDSPAPAPTPAKPVYTPAPVAYGRKLSNYYKPVYTPAPVVVKKPVVVAPAPKCENKCTTVQVPVTTCLAQCVYDICPSPKPTPVFVKPIYNKPIYKPTPASPKATPSPMMKPKMPKLDIGNIKKEILGKFGKSGDK